jgi:hypothetical protein
MMNISNFYTDALQSLSPQDTSFVLKDDDLTTLKWLDSSNNEVVVTVTNEDIEAKAQELLDAYNAADYARNRAEAYPSIADQLDMIFHAGLGGDEFQAAIQAVKDAYPKPE